MAWSPYQLFLTVLQVTTGSINTLSTKWADKMESENSAGEMRHFQHPFLQACGMFVGEMSCLVVFKLLFLYNKYTQTKSEGVKKLLKGNQNFNPFIFFLPAICDMTGTSIMYVGLNLTYASSFQMLRGAVIIFTGLLSVAFLGRKLKIYEWLGILTVIVGLSVVGSSDFIFSDNSSYAVNDIITGDELIVLAQVMTATQMVLEEKFVTKHNVPALQAVGWEGIFGLTVLIILQFPMYYIKVPPPFSANPRGVLEDALDGFVQLSNNGMLTFAFCGTIISIAFFNFAGVSVTKELSATTRMVLDSIRTIVIWAVSLAVAWQQFYALQLLGFALLLAGMFLYNDVIIMPLVRKCKNSDKRLSKTETRADKTGLENISYQNDLNLHEREDAPKEDTHI